ncbi:MAG: 50S ribosomal protein L25/general stress protein Ctc [Gammaproteobacteria bacterium]
MSSVFEFVAERRGKPGKNAARAVRREGKIPAIMYGGSDAPEMLVLDHNEVIKHLEHEAVYSHVLDINIDGSTKKAVLKAVQRHPAKPKILHMDFFRVSGDEKIKMHVPLHFINESGSVGAKKGGIVMHNMVDVEVSCLASNLPEFIAVDLTQLDIGEALYTSQLALPEGVELISVGHGHAGDHESDVAVVSIVPPSVESSPSASADSSGTE